MLPDPDGAAGALEEVRHALGSHPAVAGRVELAAGRWLLRLPDLRQLQDLLTPQGLVLVRVSGRCPETLVAAAALGLATAPDPVVEAPTGAAEPPAAPAQNLLIHRGTLRSGDHLQSDVSVLLLGDVNPGARISAGGHVLVWGRLRGVAHAGVGGHRDARIVALQLRPLQLRIAESVARGPADPPPPGLAEQARLVGGEIQIEPAPSLWPLDG